MGNWNINIQGIGPHHNRPNDIFDANNMAAEFVRLLARTGHTVQAATFTHGGAESLFDSGPSSRLPAANSERTQPVPLGQEIRFGDVVAHVRHDCPYIEIGEVVGHGGSVGEVVMGSIASIRVKIRFGSVFLKEVDESTTSLVDKKDLVRIGGKRHGWFGGVG